MTKCDVTANTGAEQMTVTWQGDTWDVNLSPDVAQRVMDIVGHGKKRQQKTLRGWEGFAAKFQPKPIKG